MLLTVLRLDDRHHYETLIRRVDGVSYQVKGVGHMYAIPHDLAHLAIEEALHLPRGFWGTVADGGVFASMTYLNGRRKPHAAERSKAVLEANEPTIAEAEVLVSVFNTALEEGLGADSPVLRARVRERWTPAGQPPRRITDDDITLACEAWRHMQSLWRDLPVGGVLSFVWWGGSRQATRRRSPPRRANARTRWPVEHLHESSFRRN